MARENNLLLAHSYSEGKGSRIEAATLVPDVGDLVFASIASRWHRYTFTTSTVACLRTERWMGVRMSPGQESRFFYVQDGLLLNPVKVDTLFAGTTGVVVCEDIRTDLSHLEPIRDEQVESDLRWLCEQEKECVLSQQGALKSVQEAERRQVPQRVREYWRKEFARVL